MSTQDHFETELAAALAARADAAVRPDAVDRVRNVDYVPRAHRIRTPVTLGVLAGSAGAVSAVTVVLVGSATPAYAGWSPTPTETSTAPAPSAAASCRSQLSSMPGPGGSPSPSAGSGSWQDVLTDLRGPFTVALYQNGDDYAVCFTSSSFTEIDQVESSGSSGTISNGVMTQVQRRRTGGGLGRVGAPVTAVGSVSRTSSGDLDVVLQNHLSTSGDGPYTLVDGRTAAGVSGVTLVRDDGGDVVATVADGWFVAWWPGDASATAAKVTTGAGTTTESLVTGPSAPPPPSSGTCPSGTSGATGHTGPGGSGTAISCSGSTRVSGSGPAAGGPGPATSSGASTGSGTSGTGVTGDSAS
jgi:hypothetical protein